MLNRLHGNDNIIFFFIALDKFAPILLTIQIDLMEGNGTMILEISLININRLNEKAVIIEPLRKSAFSGSYINNIDIIFFILFFASLTTEKPGCASRYLPLSIDPRNTQAPSFRVLSSSFYHFLIYAQKLFADCIVAKFIFSIFADLF